MTTPRSNAQACRTPVTPHRKAALLMALLFAICFPAISARAQETSNKKTVVAHFEVLHMFINSIQVRNPDNMREIHTFVYSDNIRDEMQQRFSSAPYQYGDRVTIWYQPGAEIALKIKGKPSKPH
jgi:hypothetical protein